LDAGIRLDNGEAIYTELLNVPLATPRFDQGPKSGSLTLTGSGLRSLPAGKAVTMAAVQYRSFSDGKRLIKSAVDWNLSVTDTVSDNGSSWQVGEITYAVAASPPSESMTVMEMD
jgi:hypothetical protein